jgi:hypothetical protein
MFDHANGYLSPASAMDAEEFFQAKRDAELGRWRSPLHPDYVVYLIGYEALVIGEHVGLSQRFERSAVDAASSRVPEQVAAAYFEAHPERKPWHDAKPGEVWLLTLDGVESAFYPSKSLDRHFTPVAPSTGTTAVTFDWPEIEAGRRIWPEDAS